MTKEEAFAIWAPESSIWTPWVKPILFSYLDRRPLVETKLPSVDISWAPPAEAVAVVVDAPGVDSIALGVALAVKGYRPIPLFNSIPLPADSPGFDQSGLPVAVIDSLSMLGPLHESSLELAKLKLAQNAPPVFLLDANRGGPVTIQTDRFDNRSASFSTDFPSAKVLRGQGILNAILATNGALQPQRDLAHTLFRWQEAGISIASKRLLVSSPVQSITVERPPRFRAFFQRALDALRLRRNPYGGYGSWMPDAEGHGGGG